MAQGNSGLLTDTTWYRQTAAAPLIQKQKVLDVSFVDLPNNYYRPDEFMAAYNSQWNDGTGAKQILKIWDATETNKTVNKYCDFVKVYMWVTETGSGMYHLYIGGKGGVLRPERR